MSAEPMLGQGRIVSGRVAIRPTLAERWHDGALAFERRDWVCDELELEWVASHHLVVVTNAGSTELTEVRGDGRFSYEGRDRPGSVSFVPAGMPRRCAYRGARLNYSALWIRPDFVDSWQLPRPGLELKVNMRDEVLATVIRSLADAAPGTGAGPARGYAEQAAMLVLARLGSAGPAPAPRVAGRLSRAVLRRVHDHIEARLGSCISLADLAAAAGLSPDPFARRYRATTGRTPYQAVLEHRVMRAAERLRRGDADLGALALQLGFSSQSHLTATFRRMLGTTPGAYRRNPPGS